MKPNHLYIDTLTIQTATEVNDHGSVSNTYVDTSGVACRFNHMTGSEMAKYNQRASQVGVKFYIDPSYNITIKDRISYSGTDYEIVNINPNDNMGRFLTVECFQVLP